jgi:hypothetical protein
MIACQNAAATALTQPSSTQDSISTNLNLSTEQDHAANFLIPKIPIEPGLLSSTTSQNYPDMYNRFGQIHHFPVGFHHTTTSPAYWAGQGIPNAR